MSPAKRTKLLSVIGAFIANGASIYAISNRPKPFGFGDVLCLGILNSMFFCFYWFASTRMGTQDLKNIVRAQTSKEPPDEL